MRNTEFQALNTWNTLAEVGVLVTGVKFFFAGAAGYRLTADVMGKQVGNTALRHKIQYCVKDDTTVGYHYVNDILEHDDAANQTKTTTRKNQSAHVSTRDDDGARDIKGRTGVWA